MKGITVIIVVIALVLTVDSLAQGKGGNKNKGKQGGKEVGPPPWAPAHGYRAKTRYVYFQDYGVYYDNTKGVYISLSGKNWEVNAKLPQILNGVDLKVATKIDLDFDGDSPQRNYDTHKQKYPKKK